MASYQVLLLVLVAVACSLFAVSIGWCTQSNLSSCSFEIQVCCNNECVFGSGCLGGFCSMDSDCAVSESCCESRCRSDCLGYLYFTESDRGSKSSSYDSSDTTPIVTYAAIAGVVIIACLFFACLYCYVYRQRQVLRRGQRVKPAMLRPQEMHQKVPHPTLDRNHLHTNIATQTTLHLNTNNISRPRLLHTALGQRLQVIILPLMLTV